MSLIQSKFCGLCRGELTPDDFYEIVSIPLFGQIQDVHVKCIDDFPDMKDQMQIFDQETFKQLEKEKKRLQERLKSSEETEKHLVNEMKQLITKHTDVQEKVQNLKQFNQFIVDNYEIIGLIKNHEKQQGIQEFNIASNYVIQNGNQLVLDEDCYPWDSSYLIHDIIVQVGDLATPVNLSFQYGFIHRQTGQIRYIMGYSESEKKITPLGNFQRYQPIKFGPEGFSWFNSKKYFPVLKIEHIPGIENYKIQIHYESFLDLSDFRSSNPNLFKSKETRLRKIKNAFRRKEKT